MTKSANSDSELPTDLSNNKLGGRSYYSCKIYGKLLIHYCQ